MKVLVLGASGMLGHAVIRVLSQDTRHDVFASVRSSAALRYFTADVASNIITGVDVENTDVLMRLFSRIRPDAVVNCVGLVKQFAEAEDPLLALPVNALLPHRLAHLCDLVRARLIHISTDCVFSGTKGGYSEADPVDAQDLYGRSKILGEVDYPHAVTLRTSIIGPELNSSHGLIGWFLSQQAPIKGYTRAIFSGLPTCELAKVILDRVLPNPELQGLYQVAAEPISKYDLLRLVNREFNCGVHIEPDDTVRIDRSLNGARFREATGYVAAPWPQLISQMRTFQEEMERCSQTRH